MAEKLILVNDEDKPIGTDEKLKVHKEGKLHRAFSIYIFNDKDEMLLQQRALGKYHSAGKWSCSCCGHPRPGELTQQAAERRLNEEFGIKAKLKEITSFIYKASLDKGLQENEFLYIFTGCFEGDIAPDPIEIMNFRWMSLDKINDDIKKNPDKYSEWFKLTLKRVKDEELIN